MPETLQAAGRVPPSDFFVYRQSTLHGEQVPLAPLAAQLDTPLFVYSAAAIGAAYRSIDQALSFAEHRIAYAVKANGTLALLQRLAALGCGADIVSAGELLRALRAGMQPQQIIFSGVGKRDDELLLAIQHGIRSIHIESAAELVAIERLAVEQHTTVSVCLRLNPDIDAQTHPYIATGLHDSKFGLDLAAARTLLPQLAASKHLQLCGLACHIGSQLPSPQPLQEAAACVAAFWRECRAAGFDRLRLLDLGGGWPVVYGDEATAPPPYSAYGAALRQGLRQGGLALDGIELWIEPGRALVADAGVLLTRVVFVKDRPGKRFVIVDAAMTELLRPALYDAYHAIMPVAQAANDALMERVDVVGPVCESGDFFAKSRALPPLQRGDLVALRGAGAYAACMASPYNARRRAAEVLIDGSRWQVIRRRETYEDLWHLESLSAAP